MTLTAYALLALTILLSSFISGVFGMAGGMILLGAMSGPWTNSSAYRSRLQRMRSRWKSAASPERLARFAALTTAA